MPGGGADHCEICRWHRGIEPAGDEGAARREYGPALAPAATGAASAVFAVAGDIAKRDGRGGDIAGDRPISIGDVIGRRFIAMTGGSRAAHTCRAKADPGPGQADRRANMRASRRGGIGLVLGDDGDDNLMRTQPAMPRASPDAPVSREASAVRLQGRTCPQPARTGVGRIEAYGVVRHSVP